MRKKAPFYVPLFLIYDTCYINNLFKNILSHLEGASMVRLMLLKINGSWRMNRAEIE